MIRSESNASPVEYERMHYTVSGGNPELCEKFAQLRANLVILEYLDHPARRNDGIAREGH